MSDLEFHRPVTVTVANERLQIRTDLPEAELKEMLDFIDERYAGYEKYNLDASKRLALVALEIAQQLFEARKRLHQAKVVKEQMDQGIKDLTSLLEEGIDHPEPWA